MRKAKEAISFAQAIQSKSNSLGEFWAPLNEYIELCKDWISEQQFDSENILRKYEGDLLENEKHTWKLLKLLEDERTKLQQESSLTRRSLVAFTDKQRLRVLLETDAQLRENMIVTSWLESIAEDKLQIFNQDVQWLNTLHSFQSRRDHPSPLDPDAIFRETKLHPDDIEEEKRLNKQIWDLLRAGKLSNAIQLCRSSNQFWKASSLGGYWSQKIQEVDIGKESSSYLFNAYSPIIEGTQLLHDAVIEGEIGEYEGKNQVSLSGNSFRNIWRFSCFQIATNKQLEEDIFQRAIYGVLCGHLPAILPVCKNNWLDHLWAHFICLIDSKFEQALKSHFNPFLEEEDFSFKSQETSSLLFSNNEILTDNKMQTTTTSMIMPEEQIFNSLRAISSNDKKTGNSGQDYFQIIQEFLILAKIDKLVIQLSEWCSIEFPSSSSSSAINVKKKRECPSNLLRFAAHLILYYFQNNLCENIENHADEMEITNSNRNNVLYHARRVIIAYLDQLSEFLSSKSISSSVSVADNKEDERKTIIELIIMYASVLPVELQIPYLAKFLFENIVDANEKKLCIQYINNYGLNVIAIIHLVVEYSISSIIASSYSPSTLSDLISVDDLKSLHTNTIHLSYLLHISSEERIRLRSLEWLTSSISVISESDDLQQEIKHEKMNQFAKLTLVMANSLSRCFFLLRKLEAVEELFANVVGDTIFDILGDSLAESSMVIQHTQAIELIGENGKPFSLLIHYESEMKEYLCYKAYLEAIRAFSQWHSIHYSVPVSPTQPTTNEYADKVAYNQKLKQYADDLEKHSELKTTWFQKANELLMNVIVFPRGWLQFSLEEVTEGTEEIHKVSARLKQLEFIRKEYIPNTFFMIHTLLFNMSQIKASIQLADLIVDEHQKLYRFFTKEELSTFLELVWQSCCNAVDLGSDPLGFPIVINK